MKAWKNSLNTRTVLLAFSFLISSAMTMSFSGSFGNDLLQCILLGAVGLVFEMVKVYAWEHAKGSVAFKALGILATTFSLLASIAFATLAVEQGTEAGEAQVRVKNSNSVVMAQTLAESESLQQSLSVQKPTRVKNILDFAEELRNLRAEVKDQQKQDASQSTLPAPKASVLAMSLAGRFGWNAAMIVLGILSFMALILEVVIGVLSYKRVPPYGSILGATDFEAGARFLKEAVDSDGRVLSRRVLVAAGWNERSLRRISGKLLDLGILENPGRGGALRIAESAKKSE